MFKEIKCEQRSPEWFEARLGDYSGSLADKLITATGKESTQSVKQNWRLVAELIEGKTDEGFKSEAMERGTALEDDALFELNMAYDHDFQKVGYLKAINELGEELGYGCSPDGFDFEQILGAEIKCPLSHTHIEYFAGQALPEKYKAQVQLSMLVTGAKKWIFFSYHPEYPALYIEVERDEKYIEALKTFLEKNCKTVKEKTEWIKSQLAVEA